MKVNERVKVLYIAGASRSGSTLLDNLLGQIPGLFSAGELKYFGARNLSSGGYCGCGRLFSNCGVWSDILAAENISGADSEVFKMLDRELRTRAALRTWLPAVDRRTRTHVAAAASRLGDLYRAIQVQTDSNFIVDSSKVPSYGHFLGALPGVDLFVVHLVRDPRAVAYSWTRKIPVPDPDNDKYMPLLSPIDTSIRWNMENLATEAFWRAGSDRYRLVKYEDLVLRPEVSIRSIVEMIGLNISGFPFIGTGAVELRPTHTASGNPSRFRTGLVPLQLDDEWRTAMRASSRHLVTAITWPLLRRYGYAR